MHTLIINKLDFKPQQKALAYVIIVDAYILVKGKISVNNTAADGAIANNINKKVIFKNCAPFTKYISKINNTQIDDAKYINIVGPMCYRIQ